MVEMGIIFSRYLNTGMVVDYRKGGNSETERIFSGI